MSNETKEILTIAGKRVRVEHAKFGDDTCAKCCFGDTDLCHGVDAVFPCERFDFETAYFVNADEIGVEYCEQNCKGFQETGRCFADGECDAKKAEEIEGVSQEVTLIPSNEDADNAVEEAVRTYADKRLADKDPNLAGSGYARHRKMSQECFDGYDVEQAYADGIAYERERKTQRVGEEWGDKVAENQEIIFSTDGELTVYSFVGAPRWWATIREAEEALSVFKAGICWRKAQMEKRITLIQKSWYEQGKIDGKYEGLTDDEKYQQGAFDERERMMKEAVEAELWRHNGTTLRVNAVLPKDSPVRLGDKVSVIIIKKEK